MTDGTAGRRSVSTLFDDHLQLLALRLAQSGGHRLHCTIAVHDGFRRRHAAASDAPAAFCAAAEVGAAAGPSIDATDVLGVVLVPDLADADPTRWSRWLEACRRAHFRAAGAFPVHLDGRARAAVSFYSERPETWGRELVLQCDAHAQMAAGAIELGLCLEEVEDRSRALVTTLAGQPVVDQAVGVIMATNGCDAGDAWAILRSASRHDGADLHDVARELIERLLGPHEGLPSDVAEHDVPSRPAPPGDGRDTAAPATAHPITGAAPAT